MKKTRFFCQTKTNSPVGVRGKLAAADEEGERKSVEIGLQKEKRFLLVEKGSGLMGK
jgi:hypothetical protein